MENLEKEFSFFNENLDRLKKEYLNTFVVIKGQKVIGAYKSFDEAMSKTLKTEEIGTFLVQKVDEKPETYTIYYNDMVLI